MTTMNWIPVESSNLERVRYLAETMTLEIQFKDGSVYQYFDVPETVFNELLAAESKGKFLHQQIKGFYRYAKV